MDGCLGVQSFVSYSHTFTHFNIMAHVTDVIGRQDSVSSYNSIITVAAAAASTTGCHVLMLCSVYLCNCEIQFSRFYRATHFMQTLQFCDSIVIFCDILWIH